MHTRPMAVALGIALVGVGGLTVLPGVASAAPAAASAAAAHGSWPAQVAGRPADVKAGSPAGYYLWHSSDGWRLEVTHPGNARTVFTGTISTNGALSFQRVRDEPGDATRLGPFNHVLSFSFNNFGRLDGVHFRAAKAATLRFALFIDGEPAAAASVDIGAGSLHPDRVPFTVSRTTIR